MKDASYDEIIPESKYHLDLDRQAWLDALLKNKLFSIIILRSIRDQDGKIIDFLMQYVNKTAETSVNRGELTGSFFLEEFTEGQITELFPYFAEVNETGTSWEGEINLTTAEDTGSQWCYIQAEKLDDGCLVLFSDITAQKTIELRLEEAKNATNRFASLFNNMDHGFCIIEVLFNKDDQPVDYIFLENNPAFERLTGLKEFKENSIRKLLPELEEGWFEKFGMVAKTRQSLRFEGKISTGSRELWYDVNAFPIDEPTENHVAVLFNNITNRKKRADNFRCMLEQKVNERTAELKESRDFIKHITDTTPDILYIIDLPERKISYVSKSINSLGYTPDEIYSMGSSAFQNLVHPDDYEERLNNILRMNTFREEEVRATEFRVRDKEGKWHWVNNRTTVFKTGENNRPLEILGIALDITARKETEAAYHKEMDRSRELKRLNDLMDTFVYAAAHDLKAPISNLMLLTDIIDSTESVNKKLELQKRYFPVIDTLNRTISGMINVLSIEKNSKTGVKRINFKDIVDQILSELHEKIKEVNPVISCRFRYCKSIIYNESYLLSIFRNMITNSLKYRAESRQLVIEIRSEKIGEQVVLTFSDNGIGIDLQRYGDELFKPFRRFGSKSEGSGIGLHLVKSIVTKNGGNIEVRSTPCEGTDFRIFLVEYK